MNKNLTQLVLHKLKELMRQKKLNYAVVARHLKMSESGFKKLMTGRELQLSKIEKICDVLEISFIELMQSFEKEKIRGVTFSPEQEEYFLKNHRSFLFYWLLVYERRPLAEVQRILELSLVQSEKILFQLDRYNFLKYYSKDKIQIPKVESVKWIGDSEFIKKIFQQWSILFMERMAKPEIAPDEFFAIHSWQMLPETYLEFIEAFRKLQTQYSTKAIYEMRLFPREQLQQVRWVAAVDQCSFVDEELK